MKLLLVAFALIGIATAAQVPDSATQGPNPQDIATPEPEYIDIDGPEPGAPGAAAGSSAAAGASAALPARSSNFISAPIPRPIPRPVQRASVTHFAPAPQRSFAALPQISFASRVAQQLQQLPGHSYSRQSGYQYRHPVYVRRVHRRFF